MITNMKNDYDTESKILCISDVLSENPFNNFAVVENKPYIPTCNDEMERALEYLEDGLNSQRGWAIRIYTQALDKTSAWRKEFVEQERCDLDEFLAWVYLAGREAQLEEMAEMGVI